MVLNQIEDQGSCRSPSRAAVIAHAVQRRSPLAVMKGSGRGRGGRGWAEERGCVCVSVSASCMHACIEPLSIFLYGLLLYFGRPGFGKQKRKKKRKTKTKMDVDFCARERNKTFKPDDSAAVLGRGGGKGRTDATASCVRTWMDHAKTSDDSPGGGQMDEGGGRLCQIRGAAIRFRPS